MLSQHFWMEETKPVQVNVAVVYWMSVCVSVNAT